MDSEEQEILSELKRAFRDTPRPTWDRTFRGHELWDQVFQCAIEDEEAVDARSIVERYQSWEDIPIVALRNSISLLNSTPEAFPFFLAAYVRAALVDADLFDAGVLTLIDKLRLREDDILAPSQFAALSAEQTHAVRRYVEYSIDRDFGRTYRPDILRAWQIRTDSRGARIRDV